jgi:cell division inhibitor SulA
MKYYYEGNIDCVIGWNRSLSAAEHKRLYELFKVKTIYPNNTQKRQRGM